MTDRDDFGRPATPDNTRDYMFQMLSEIAKMAAECGEHGIALVLNTIVSTRSPPPSSVMPADAPGEPVDPRRDKPDQFQ